MGFLGAAISGLGSLFGGLFGSNASQNAASQYVKALQQAQGFMQDQEKQGVANYSPFLNAGQGAVGTLSSLLGTPGQGLLQPWTGTFQAPTAAQAEATPGYQFQLHQGLGAVQNSAAGRGSLLSGRTLADLNNYAQGVASTNYQNVFNNALTQYQTSYNSFLNNQNNQYQRLLGLSGIGTVDDGNGQRHCLAHRTAGRGQGSWNHWRGECDFQRGGRRIELHRKLPDPAKPHGW